MFIVYFALWVILNGKWTTEIGIFGLVFAGLLYAFCCRFTGYSFKKDLRFVRRLPSAIHYGVTLLCEIFKANVTVIKMILDKSFEPKPQLVRFESGLMELRHRVVLADSITLTPGTITCQLEGDHYLVHCLDESLMSGLDDGVFVSALSRMEEKQKFMADSVTGEAADAQTEQPEAAQMDVQSEEMPEAVSGDAQTEETPDTVDTQAEEDAQEENHEH